MMGHSFLSSSARRRRRRRTRVYLALLSPQNRVTTNIIFPRTRERFSKWFRVYEFFLSL